MKAFFQTLLWYFDRYGGPVLLTITALYLTIHVIKVLAQ